MEREPVSSRGEPEAISVALPFSPAGRASRAPVRVLSPETAARIAAGEVIERPASVVKELVENAIDAAASRIRVDVLGGGLSMIRVGDDGIGIPPDQLWLACQRHATSKLRDDDLISVDTLGFRGEALPSIATVAEMSIVSTAGDDGLGRRLTLHDGRVLADEPAARPRGTTVMVRRLFERVPARLASAARTQTELSQISQTIRRLALASPAIRFALYVDDRLTLQTSGTGEIATTMIELYGPGVGGSLIELGPLEEPGAVIRGVISGPELTRPGRSQVNLIVNHRWVQPRGLLAVVEGAYRPLLPRGRHPMLTLSIDVPAADVDVNIHPSKLDVRLRNERSIGPVLGQMVRDALGTRPIEWREPLSFGRAALDPLHELRESSIGWDEDRLIVSPSLPPLRLIGQVQQRLVLLEGAEGLYLVDQHRAHERIIFERLSSNRAKRQPEHMLPEPLLIELRPAQVARFARRLDEFAALGFQFEEFGGRSFLLRSAPVLPGVLHSLDGRAGAGVDTVGEPDDLVPALLSLTMEADDSAEGWQERLMVSLACRTALRRGRALDRATMRLLVEALGHTPSLAVCPHGSPLLMHLSGSLLERQFDWR